MSLNFAHTLAEQEAAPRIPIGAGVVIGKVVNNQDNEGLGRVKVKFEWLDDFTDSAWARIAAPMAGNGRGVFFLPEIDDEVLVAFEHGDVRFPYVVGCLWNGVDRPPEDNADGNNDISVIKSRSGHVIRLNDKRGHETIEIIDARGNNSVVINTRTNDITITAAHNISLLAPNGTIHLEAKFIEIESDNDTTIAASGQLDLAADGDVVVGGKTVQLN